MIAVSHLSKRRHSSAHNIDSVVGNLPDHHGISGKSGISVPEGGPKIPDFPLIFKPLDNA